MGTRPTGDAVLTAYARSVIRFKAHQLSRKPGCSRSDEEDFAQELTACLLAQAHLFDPKRASVDTFADRVVNSAVAMILRSRRRQKRAAGFKAISLESTSAREGGKTVPLRDVLAPSDLDRRTGMDSGNTPPSDLSSHVMEAWQSLAPDLQDVCKLLMEMREAAVAKAMGISRRQVRSCIERIRVHFESQGFGSD